MKSQNQNPMLPSVNFWDKNLIFLYIVSLHTQTARFKWVGHKNELFFLGNTLIPGQAQCLSLGNKYHHNHHQYLLYQKPIPTHSSYIESPYDERVQLALVSEVVDGAAVDDSRDCSCSLLQMGHIADRAPLKCHYVQQRLPMTILTFHEKIWVDSHFFSVSKKKYFFLEMASGAPPPPSIDSSLVLEGSSSLQALFAMCPVCSREQLQFLAVLD